MRRRSNFLAAEIGLAVALVVVVAAFRADLNAPLPEPKTPQRGHEPIELVLLPATIQQAEVAVPDPPKPDVQPAERADATPIALELLRLPRLDAPSAGESVLPPLREPLTRPVDEPPPVYVEPGIVLAPEIFPELIGGLEALQSAIIYPACALRASIEGRVLLRFVVNTDGSVSDIEVTRGIGGGCDEAAVDALMAARFTPGFQNGRPVRVRFAIPVTFRQR